MPTMKPKIKVKRPLPPQAGGRRKTDPNNESDVKLLKKANAELRGHYVDLLARHSKLAAKVDGHDARLEGVETTAGNHEDRLDELEGVCNQEAVASDKDAKCRCAKGHEGKDPDCYVHGNSFDASDRPSRTKPIGDPRQTTLDQAIDRAKEREGTDANGSPVEGDAQNASRVE